VVEVSIETVSFVRVDVLLLSLSEEATGWSPFLEENFVALEGMKSGVAVFDLVGKHADGEIL
jgi:hypothetical protein